MNKNILFVHIPKTAGTSFRKSAEEYFGSEYTFYDYSAKSPDTSDEVIEKIYNSNDPYSLYKSISKKKHSFLSGHFYTSRYAPLYDSLNVVSFVRDPVEQVVSHYNHFKNYHGYTKELIEFAREPRFANVQSKHLSGRSIALFGFLGLAEEFSASVELFNALYGTKLQYIHMNKSLEGSLDKEDIDEKSMAVIKRRNKKDIALYESVKRQFDLRLKLRSRKLPFTHAFIQKKDEYQISGLAFQRESDNAVEVDIFAGVDFLATVTASTIRPGMVRNNVPRKGYIGFDYVYKGEAALGDKLRAVVKATGQEIG